MPCVNRIRAAALGEEPADLVLKNARVLDVFTDAFYPADVAVCGEEIVGVGPGYRGRREIDCRGRYLIPGLIDAHIHIESTLATPCELGRQVVRKGTTTCVADPHELVNVKGAAALRWLLAAAADTPVRYEVMLPSAVPATPFDTNGAGRFTAADMAPFAADPGVRGLGEVMCFHEVVDGAPEAWDKLALFRGRPIDGHAPGLTGRALNLYRASGVMTDHECTTADEALEKLRAGFSILIREGSGAHNLDALVAGLLAHPAAFAHCAFCTDDKHMDDIAARGHINYCVNRAVALGVDPVTAIKMASTVPAALYGLQDRGAIFAGCKANLLLVDDPRRIEPVLVITRGAEVTDGWLAAFSEPPIPAELLDTVHFPPLTPARLAVPARAENDVIALVPGQLLTEHRRAAVPAKDGRFIPDETYAKLCVVERHGRSGGAAACPVTGFGLRGGAIATSVSHDSHNIVAVGDNDADLIAAIERLRVLHGGYAVVSGGRVLAEIALPVAGLITPEPAAAAEEGSAAVRAAARKLGVPEDIDPIANLSFLALPVIPHIRLLDTGLFDVDNFRLMD